VKLIRGVEMSGYDEMMVFEQIEKLTRDLKNSYVKEISELRRQVIELKKLVAELERKNGNA